MKYYSLGNRHDLVSAEAAIRSGLAPDGSLYMPERILSLDFAALAEAGAALPELGTRVAQAFLGEEIEEAALAGIVREAINFPAPLIEIEPHTWVLELFHGPTLAFKDFGARFMARVLGHFRRNADTSLTVLVATSGDTGSAVAQGFYRVPGVEVVLLYPKGMVSKLQEQQLTTLGENITALEVAGSFDDCQRIVKSAFVDPEITACMELTSANSINIARLIPQSFYYLSAAVELFQRGMPSVSFSVPSGNFGNLTGGLLAKRMGMPASRFIAATNANDSVVRFLNGTDFEPTSTIPTISNAMDVGNPSNFPRLLELCARSRTAMAEEVFGVSCSDEETKACIERVYRKVGYVLDPHAAVGYLGLEKARAAGLNGPGVILGTAHPGKFIDTLDTVLPGVVSLPETLQQVLRLPKQARLISDRFEDFKDFLVSERQA